LSAIPYVEIETLWREAPKDTSMDPVTPPSLIARLIFPFVTSPEGGREKKGRMVSRPFPRLALPA